MQAVTDWGVARLRAALDRRMLSAVELAEAALARASETQEAVGAFVLLDPPGALRAARQADGELARGRARSPLHGIPLAVKDVIDVAGLPTRAGTRLLVADAAEADAGVVARLRAAGMVIVGKTATHPLAMGVSTRAVRHPACPERLAGGSSGGSAAAVAVGAVPVALGTDTAGSIRVPAALCGVAGLVPRRGLLPRDGIVPLACSFDVPGLLARTAADLALAWPTLDPNAAALPGRRLRAAPLGGWSDEEAAGSLGVMDRAARHDWDWRPEPVRALDATAARAAGQVIVAEALEAHRRLGWWPELRDRYPADAAAQLRAAERLPADAVTRARARLRDVAAAIHAALQDVDVLVAPVTPGTAPSARLAGDADLVAAERALTATLTRFTSPFNVAKVASAAVPAGRGDDGLPLGVQLVARDEATLLAAAALIDESEPIS